MIRTRLSYNQSGIYQIVSILNGKQYIGSAVDCKIRKIHHFSSLRKEKHTNQHLQRHFNKYGEQDLQFSILEFCSKEDLLIKEQAAIESYNPEFNMCKIAGSTLGLKWKPDSRKKGSDCKIGAKNPSFGVPKTENQKRAISLRHTGKFVSEETRQKLRISSSRLVHTDETKKKISELGKGRVPWNKGLSTSEEVKLKISQSGKGKHPHSEELKLKISKARKGKKYPKKDIIN